MGSLVAQVTTSRDALLLAMATVLNGDELAQLQHDTGWRLSRPDRGGEPAAPTALSNPTTTGLTP